MVLLAGLWFYAKPVAFCRQVLTEIDLQLPRHTAAGRSEGTANCQGYVTVLQQTTGQLHLIAQRSLDEDEDGD